jgi:hypothetical protein
VADTTRGMDRTFYGGTIMKTSSTKQTTKTARGAAHVRPVDDHLAPSADVLAARELATRTRAEFEALVQESETTKGTDRENRLSLGALLLEGASGCEHQAAISGIIRLAMMQLQIFRNADFEFVSDEAYDMVLFSIEHRLELAAQLVERMGVTTSAGEP